MLFRVVCIVSAQNFKRMDSVQKLVNIDLDKIQRLEALSFSLSLIKVEPLFIYAVNSFLIM